ncbi:AI-2E family transporter [Parvimonas micra]|uniref:AI-2E family transporter n=1 Tax=Parvimonas micra TaxID=33033 RepID=A0A9X3HAM8_9FIRM|nr:AI-2E family transporter [Parvimonas micra]MCZ7407828.1 AI-2E family transporter [Parvimonas micra]MCZ7410460.1 AI-2E family transporter [Parvimonas micra]MCZ7412342.1 AI-2E family transporter [Parvimonas micra]WBB36604.1 AI-2E family transporter [Parvimonas micra]
MYISYMKAMLKKCKKSFKDYLQIQGILVLLAMFTSLIAVYLMNYPGKFKAGLIMGILEAVPIIGNGLYLSYQIVINLINHEVVISSNLAILYLTILCVRLVLEPILLGRKLNFRIGIIIFLALVSKFIGGNSGLAIMTVIIFVLNTLININDIYSFDQKRKMKERKEKRLRERELRKKYDYESVGDDHDN